MRPKKKKNENLVNPLKKKHKISNETSDSHGKSVVEESNKLICGNLDNPLMKKRKKFHEMSDPNGSLANPLKKQQQKSFETSDSHGKSVVELSNKLIHGNLDSSPMKKRRKSNEISDLNGNLANPLKKKKKSDENSSKKRKKYEENTEKTESNWNLTNPLKKKQKNLEENSNKASLSNQIVIREADMPQRFNLLRCHRFCKGKNILEPSNNTIELMDIVDQAIEIFHEEIIIEILIRLPVRSLVRFKCVSKPWKALISDIYFKRKHLNHAKNVQNFQKLFVARMGRISSYKKCTFHCSSLLSSVQPVEDEEKLDFPWNWKPVGSFPLCSCDGLVLLAINDNTCVGRINGHLLLCNPATRESVELPCPNLQLRHCVFGMGYDTSSNDYKMLAIDLNAGGFEGSCEILALKSGSWRACMYYSGVCRMDGYMDCGMDSLAFLHGAFHWVIWKKYYTILSFNISNEVRREIPLLDGMLYKSNNYIEHGVSELGGMLCFYSTYRREVEPPLECTFMLWVMKDYGIKESWTLLFKIQDSNLFSSARPKYRYADGEVLLQCKHRLLCGNIFRTSRGPFGVWPEVTIAYEGAVVYTESLISPKLLLPLT